ncbi:ABC transporter substrate-binding protein [Planomonospora sphaerica]|nr:ABC transporter substrate-binding protein [Planomonospora sphaerica]
MGACSEPERATGNSALDPICNEHAQALPAEGSAIPDVERPEKSEIRVGIMPIPDVAAFQIALDCRFFQRVGLEVEAQKIQGAGPAIPDLETGRLQFSLLNYVTAFSAQAKKVIDLRFVADAYQAEPGTFLLMVPQDSSLQTPADLRGKVVAVATLHSIGTITTTLAAGVHGVKPDDFEMVEIPLNEMPGALAKGRVDAAWMTEPFITVVQRQGARTIADVMDGPTEKFPIAGWGTSAAFAAKHRKTVAAFQKAIAAGQQIAAKDRSAVVKRLPKYTKITPEVAEVIALGGYPTTLEAARLQRVADALVEQGYIPTALDVSPLLVALPRGAAS